MSHLYINSKGFHVTRHSYSGSTTFNDCARRYYLERVQGWGERTENAAKFFGIALEKAVTYWHQRGQDPGAAVAEFVRLWAEHKDKPYTYSKTDLDWDRLNRTGQELVRLYALKYPTFPYVVNNTQDFQVQTNIEVFPGVERFAGLEFTSYIDLIAQIKDTGEPIIIDMKTSGKDVPELTMMDPQLRSYAWVKGWANVAFLWFRKMGRTISKGDTATILAHDHGLQPGDDVVILGRNALDEWLVTPRPSVLQEMEDQFVGEKKEVKTARQTFIELNGVPVPENAFTKQRVQFKMARISRESSEDIGRQIKRDMVNIVVANESDDWAIQSGVRFPHEKCPICPMRGICSGQPELRDMLLTRKQDDELNFGNENE